MSGFFEADNDGWFIMESDNGSYFCKRSAIKAAPGSVFAYKTPVLSAYIWKWGYNSHIQDASQTVFF